MLKGVFDYQVGESEASLLRADSCGSLGASARPGQPLRRALQIRHAATPTGIEDFLRAQCDYIATLRPALLPTQRSWA